MTKNQWSWSRLLVAVASALCVARLGLAQGQSTTVIRAAMLLDGRGVRIANAAIVVVGDRIGEVLVGDAARNAAKPGNLVIDLGAATVMPGLIDGHVHINSYFNAAGRIHGRNDGDTPAMTAMGIAHNLRNMLMSCVTTAQSMGAYEG